MDIFSSQNQTQNQPVIANAGRAFEDRAGDLAEQWAGSVLGDAREAELYRFTVSALRAHHEDPFSDGAVPMRSLLNASEYFSDLNLQPRLPLDRAEAIVLRALQDVRADQVQAKIKASKSESDETESAPRSKIAIRYCPDQRDTQATEAEAAMLSDAKAEPVFNHAGSYAVVRRRPSRTVRGIRLGESVATIDHLTSRASLGDRLMASVGFFTLLRSNGSNWMPNEPPDKLLDVLLSRDGGSAPPLAGLLQSPTICPDGRLVDQPGYDLGTGLYGTFEAGEFPAIRAYSIKPEPVHGEPDWLAKLPQRSDWNEECATRSAARHAAELEQAKTDAAASLNWLVSEWLGEFQFQSPVDAAAAVAALLTGVVRKTCGPAPGFLPSSPVQATGKTTLMQAIGAAVEGVAPPLNDWPSSEEEMNKVVFASLLTGRTILAFDNLENGTTVRSRTIARLLSAEEIEGRHLGASKMSAAPADVLLMLTGNNLVLEGDMVTRIIEIYLDAKVENPERRKFKRDVVAWTIAHRTDIVSRALTIMKAYLDAGAPEVPGTSTRFPVWDKLVRRAIVWAGGEDVSAKFAAASASDPVALQLRDLLSTWQPALGTQPLTAGEIVKKLESGTDFDGRTGALRDAFIAMMGGARRGLVLNARNVGAQLKKYLNRPAQGLKLVSDYDAHDKLHRWRVAACI